MHVVATAGHVDHGKSTLVRALTGTDPDRLAEERRRGLTIELGYAWTVLPGLPGLPGAGEVAFVDVPGHERFVATMLAGVGPVPAVLLVVAADDPWMPQAAEHLTALDALGVEHGVVAVTRTDLAEAAPSVARARAEVDATSLAGVPVVPVSAVTGTGLDELRARLAEMLRALPAADPAADVRLWVDRRFAVRGAGTVVTGTLAAGTVRTGDLLEAGGRSLRVRGVQSLGEPRDSVSGVARVALNLAGDVREVLDRHSVLVTPGRWHHTRTVDVRIEGGAGDPPRRPMLHVGAVAVPAYLRPLGGDSPSGLARLVLSRSLPLRVGDRMLLRDPGRRLVWGITALDPAPPELRRRGAARERAAALAGVTGVPDAAGELARRGVVHRDLLRRIGVPASAEPADAADVDGWILDPQRGRAEHARLVALVQELEGAGDWDSGTTPEALADRLGLPSPRLVQALVQPPLRLAGGRVTARPDLATPLPASVETAVAALRADLAPSPFAAPTAARMAELGLDRRAVVLASRAGVLLHLGEGVVLLPGADDAAVTLLAGLTQPFTTSEARELLGTTRRVALPLLQLLDRQGRTHRLPDDRRRVAGRVSGGESP